MDKLRILLVGGLITVEHQGRAITARLRELLEATGRFEVVYTEEFRNIGPDYLEPYDAVFIDYDGKLFPTEKARRFGEKSESALYDFVAKGKGVVFYHSSVWVDHDWPDEYRKLLGGYCDMTMGCRRCPKDDHFVEITDPDSPITKGVDAKWMNVFDDLFSPILIHPEADVHVLASIYDDIENYRVPGWPPKHHPVEIPDGNEFVIEADSVVCALGFRAPWADVDKLCEKVDESYVIGDCKNVGQIHLATNQGFYTAMSL